MKTANFKVVQYPLLSFLVTIPAIAAPNLDVSVGAGVEYHDNAALVSDNKQSDVEAITQAAVGFKNSDGPLVVDLGYSAEYRDFMDDVQEDRTTIDGSTNLLWKAIPRTLNVVLSHQISDEVRDRQVADVTDNRERRSVITAGVDGYIHVSQVDKIEISPRFSDVSLEDTSGSDSQHKALNIAWEHGLSAVSAITLRGLRENVEFDDGINDYDVERATLGYSAKLSHLTYSVEGGFNKVDRDVGKDVDGFVVRAAADYTDVGYTWGGSMVRQLTDSAIGLSGVELNLSGFKAVDGSTDEFDIVESTEAELHVIRQLSNASEITGRLGYIEQDYQTILRDEKDYYAELGYGYRLNSLWTLGVTGRFENRQFPDEPSDLEYDDSELQFYAAYRHNERFSARLGIGREQRDANISAADYTDNYALVGVNFMLY